MISEMDESDSSSDRESQTPMDADASQPDVTTSQPTQLGEHSNTAANVADTHSPNESQSSTVGERQTQTPMDAEFYSASQADVPTSQVDEHVSATAADIHSSTQPEAVVQTTTPSAHVDDNTSAISLDQVNAVIDQINIREALNASLQDVADRQGVYVCMFLFRSFKLYLC